MFTRAIELAKQSKYKKFRLGAVIVSGNKILSEGINDFKTHTFQYKCNNISRRLPEFYSAKKHAELAAVVSLPRNAVITKKVEIYVARVLENDEIAIARPCESCLIALGAKYGIGIENIFYTTQNGYAYEFIQK